MDHDDGSYSKKHRSNCINKAHFRFHFQPAKLCFYTLIFDKPSELTIQAHSTQPGYAAAVNYKWNLEQGVNINAKHF